jgi:hypothetical protein
VALLVFLFWGFGAWAKILDLRPAGPLLTRTQNPLYLLFVATPWESPHTLNRGQFETTLNTTFSNIFEYDQTGNTKLTLDMELWRTTVDVTYGLADNIDVKIEIPVISTAGGFLDSFIQWYHTTLGVPNGGRQLVANGQFTYTLSQNGTTLINYNSCDLCLSDMSIRFKYAIDQKFLPLDLAIAPILKLPTGAKRHGFGSGHFDGGLSFLAQKSLKRFHLTTQLGLGVLGGHEALDPILRSTYFSFGQSLEFQINNAIAVLGQLTGQTGVFHSVDGSPLSSVALDLNIGFAGNITLEHSWLDEFTYQLSFGEDVLSLGPSVDFSALLSIGVRY